MEKKKNKRLTKTKHLISKCNFVEQTLPQLSIEQEFPFSSSPHKYQTQSIETFLLVSFSCDQKQIYEKKKNNRERDYQSRSLSLCNCHHTEREKKKKENEKGEH
jgi:hypothetical protein